jgi:hypothetical protein
MKNILIAITALTLLVGCQTLTGVPFYSDTENSWFDMLGRATAKGLQQNAIADMNRPRPVVVQPTRQQWLEQRGITCYHSGNYIHCQ